VLDQAQGQAGPVAHELDGSLGAHDLQVEPGAEAARPSDDADRSGVGGVVQRAGHAVEDVEAQGVGLAVVHADDRDISDPFELDRHGAGR
jgi:hypothetical protein